MNERINPEKEGEPRRFAQDQPRAARLDGVPAARSRAETSTPTASSGINVRPKALRPRADSRPDGALPQARARAESRPDGLSPRPGRGPRSKPDGSVQRANSAGRAAQHRSVSDDDDETSILSSPPTPSSSPQAAASTARSIDSRARALQHGAGSYRDVAVSAARQLALDLDRARRTRCSGRGVAHSQLSRSERASACRSVESCSS